MIIIYLPECTLGLLNPSHFVELCKKALIFLAWPVLRPSINGYLQIHQVHEAAHITKASAVTIHVPSHPDTLQLKVLDESSLSLVKFVQQETSFS